MWRPGRWVYVDDDQSNDGDDQQQQRQDSLTIDSTNNDHQIPSSPPWRLSEQLPIETATFKDGRRISKRFEKLKQLKSSTDQQQQQQQQQPSSSSKKIKSKKNQKDLRRKSEPTTTRTESNSSDGIKSSNYYHKSLSHATSSTSASSSTTATTTDPFFDHSNLNQPSRSTHHPSNQPINQTLLEPISPTTIIQNPPLSPLHDHHHHHHHHHTPTLTLISQLSDLDDPIKSNTRFSLTTTEDLAQSVVDTNSVTEGPNSAEPPTPPPIEFSIVSINDPCSSLPASTDLPPPSSPPKKFKPWEALKSIQTDDTQVAGDLKLIQEGHRRNQNKSKPQQHFHRRTRGSLASTITPPAPSVTSKEQSSNQQESSRVESTTSLKRRICNHSSSDLTELSSSLSDLSEQEQEQEGSTDHQQASSSSSMVYSESDLDDDCLPEALVRKVRRPSRRTSSTTLPITNKSQKPSPSTRPSKKQKSSHSHRQDRKACLRPLESANTNSLSNSRDSRQADDEKENWEPPPYIKIKSNVYPFRKPELSEYPPPVCNCTEGGCGEKCLNRAMFYLCDPKLCQLGQSCKNIPFNQRKDLIDESSTKLGKGLKVFYTGPVKGWGLKTEIKLKKGCFLIDYRGEIISREICYKRVLNDYNGWQHFYLMDYDGSDVIDAGQKGNCARFINHSCAPNLRVERFKLPGLEEYQFGIFTLRDIEAGEELSYDYGWRNFSDIAPTSNIRTSMRTRTTVDGLASHQDFTTVKSLRQGRIPRPTNSSVSQIIRATAPTVQKCCCGAKGCKGFLGPSGRKAPPPSV